MQQSKYNVQCLNGHVFSPPIGSDLERRCAERKQLDALCVSYNECSQCQFEAEEQARRELDLCSLVGCPFSFAGEGGCEERCLATMRQHTITLGGNNVKIDIPII
jgi:hypothetical protein